MVTSSHDDLVEIEKQSAIDEAKDPESERKERPVAVLEVTEGLDWLKLASGCLRALTGTGSEQRQLDREL